MNRPPLRLGRNNSTPYTTVRHSLCVFACSSSLSLGALEPYPTRIVGSSVSFSSSTQLICLSHASVCTV